MSENHSYDSMCVLLETAIQKYEKALEELKKNDHALLGILLARDQIQFVLRQNEPYNPNQLNQIIRLDDRLRQQAAKKPMHELPSWRQALCPSDASWWWFLDQIAEKHEKEKGLPWLILAGTFLLLTSTLAVEIIRRFWDGAPDIYSIFGTLLILLLTSSPLFKHGQEFATWLLQLIPFLKPRFRAEAMAGMAGLAFAVALIVWLLLPQFAIWYNNRGLDALLASELSTAKRDFRRATAINPEQVVAYQNLADVYRRSGFPNEALAWYQKAIEQDLSFGPAYDGLSQIYNGQGKFKFAEKVSLAGLQVQHPQTERKVATVKEKEVAIVTIYKLQCNLGWAYFGQNKYDLARKTLEEAVQLENELKKLPGEFRSAIPHYYLAQLYEKQSNPKDAKEHWEAALRLLKENKWADHEWLAVVKSKLKNP